MSKSAESTISLENFSSEAKNTVTRAQKFADDSKHRLLDPAHLFAVLLDIPDIVQLIKDLDINLVHLNHQLHGYLNDLSKGRESSSLSPTMINLISRVSNAVEQRSITVFDLLVAITQETAGICCTICEQFELTSEKICQKISTTVIKDRNVSASPYLINLSAVARERGVDPIIGRDNEVRRLIQILGRRSKNHPLLVGEAGVGKRTILLSFVDRINRQVVPKFFKNVSVVQLNTAEFLSGVTDRTEIESRLKSVVKSLRGHMVVLYIRSIETLMTRGLNLNLNDFFEIVFGNSNIRVVASCSPEGLKKLIDKEPALAKEFTTINVEPTTPECAVEVLRGVAARYEKHHNIKIGEQAINTAVKLAKRYVQDRFLPESAIDLIDEAASNKMMEFTGIPVNLDKAINRVESIKAQLTGLLGDCDEVSLRARESLERELHSLTGIVNKYMAGIQSNPEVENEAILSEESIALVLGEWTGIPVNKFLEGETDKLAKMEERLSRRVVGQNEAIEAVAKSVKRSYAGLRDNKKPIGSFLFLGASGCGKTELAKALAEFLFDDEEAMTRIDMSEFREAHMAQRLIGSPPGYQGAEDGGFLTEAVKKKPYSVLLFDEIEKAHPDVFNLLLQVLDDGRLTDGRGRTADFSNTIVIMTSNIGSKKILDTPLNIFESSEGRTKIKEMLHEEMKSFLRPEFINRIDETIVFRPLAKKQLSGILEIQLALLQHMLSERGITICLSEEAKERLVDIGYEPAYGARPLKRAILRHIQDPLAEALVKGNYSRGTRINVSFSSGSFIIET